MKRRIAEIEASIERYLDQLDEADQAEPARDQRPINDKITALKEEVDRVNTPSASAGGVFTISRRLVNPCHSRLVCRNETLAR